MIVIADNLNTRNRNYMDALRRQDAGAIAEMAEGLAEAGADIINVQCSLDGAGDEEKVPFAARAVLEAVGLELSIDTRNIEALKKTLGFMKEPPLVNYLSMSEPEDREGLLSLVSSSGSSLVIRASKGVVPLSLEAKLQILEELIEEANSADIPNERLFADPSLVHIGRGMGQSHLVSSHECIAALIEMVDPPINTIAWISNVSAGMERHLRKTVECAFLLYLAGAGLDAAMLDVLDPEIEKTVYLIRAFRDEIVFTPADIS